MMKKTNTLTILALGVACAAQAQSVDFNTGLTDLTGNFTTSDTQDFTHNASRGTNGTGAITFGANSNIGDYFLNSTVDFTALGGGSAYSHSVSLDFQFIDATIPGTSGNKNILRLGFASDAADGSATGGADDYVTLVTTAGSAADSLDVSFDFNHATVNKLKGGGNIQTTIAAGEWVRLEFTVAGSDRSDTSAYATLYSLGTDGTGTPTIIFSHSHLDKPNVASLLDSAMNPFFQVGGWGNNEFDVIDNFTVASTVPEPSTYALLAGLLAFVSVALRRRSC